MNPVERTDPFTRRASWLSFGAAALLALTVGLNRLKADEEHQVAIQQTRSLVSFNVFKLSKNPSACPIGSGREDGGYSAAAWVTSQCAMALWQEVYHQEALEKVDAERAVLLGIEQERSRFVSTINALSGKNYGSRAPGIKLGITLDKNQVERLDFPAADDPFFCKDSVHASAFANDHRLPQPRYVQMDDTNVLVVNIHSTSGGSPEDVEKRHQQIRNLAAAVEHFEKVTEDKDWIVFGDTNLWTQEEALQALEKFPKGTVLLQTELPTHPATGRYFDMAFVSANLADRVVSFETINIPKNTDNLGSDHLGVELVFITGGTVQRTGTNGKTYPYSIEPDGKYLPASQK
jgi:hypothetical protein